MPGGMTRASERASACKRERGLQGRAPPERPSGAHRASSTIFIEPVGHSLTHNPQPLQ
jgi:hypothetical protein